MSTGNSAAVNFLEQEITVKEAELRSLQKALAELKCAASGSTLSVSPTEFRYGKLSLCIREFIHRYGAASEEMIIRAMEGGGRDLGKYPKRAVSLGISNNPQFLERGKDGLVHIKD